MFRNISEPKQTARCFLLGAYRKVLKWSRMVTLPMTSSAHSADVITFKMLLLLDFMLKLDELLT